MTRFDLKNTHNIFLINKLSSFSINEHIFQIFLIKKVRKKQLYIHKDNLNISNNEDAK